MSEATATAPVFVFDDGTLHVRENHIDMRFEWRPFARAEERPRALRYRWHAFWPDFRIIGRKMGTSLPPPPAILPVDLFSTVGIAQRVTGKAGAFAAFRGELPEGFAALVERFPSHQWAMLKLLREQKTMRDLAESNLPLAYCLANNAHFRDISPVAGEKLAIMHGHHKQRDILRWLGFPDSQAMVRMIQKIPPEACHIFSLRFIRRTLCEHPCA
ncbi:MAG: hypothetical protein HQ559_03310, partial [Lentisphaerae bacterium]|nr:hypothetical protein [Lentisphaerota bacterium]